MTPVANRLFSHIAWAIVIGMPALALAEAPSPLKSGATPPAPAKLAAVFQPAARAVSTWRDEAASHLVLTPDQVAAFLGPGAAPRVARCVKLNNYWCIKKAGWNGEIAADAEGHVAFASAIEGAAVAALLLKRYYVDFNRRTALAIISRWAPAQCDLGGTDGRRRRVAGSLAPNGLGKTLRARWLAGHSRGFVAPIAGRAIKVRRSVVADHHTRMMMTPMIAAGLGETTRATKPMTLDALLQSSPNAPPSRSMLGMPRRDKMAGAAQPGRLSTCGFDGARIATYVANASAGLKQASDGDLGLFAADGTPTANLALMMANMARVEIGPFGPTRALIDDGIAQAFKAGRNPDKS